MFRIFVILSLLLQTKYSVGVTLVKLAGNGWKLTGGNNTIFVETTVPNDVYMSLYNAKLIPDPYANRNDVVFRNISWQNWTYSRQFSVTSEFLKYKAIVLIVSGIDTVSSIYVNDKLIGKTRNMFRTFVLDVKSVLTYSTPNNLSIAFSSPLSYVLNQANDNKAKYGYDVPNDCPPSIEHGECYPNFIRKMQCSFAWDWGPAFPTMGIYDKNLFLVGVDTCTILQFSVVPLMDKDEQFWILNIDFFIYCAQTLSGAKFSVFVNESVLSYSWTSNVQKGNNRIQNSVKIPINRVQKWWPNGFGVQKLYVVKGAFQVLNESSSKSLNIGFRKVKLIQDPVENFTSGLTFYFKINSLPIFLKGSNWIPADSFLNRITSDQLQFYFASMKEANFNALRVWGGGVYETDKFYDLADQNGIMIFQDMAFASSLYPTNEEFLNNVKHEIFNQVNRLKHRPSIIVWSGNNEVEQGLVQGWFKLNASFDTYKSDYLKLYNATIYAVVNATDYTSRPFLMSSPSNGVNTTRSGGLDTNPASTIYGDVHIYQYLTNGWNPKNYPVPRCCTEYGFQSLPSVETLLSALPEDDLAYLSLAMLHRQHHPAGQLEMLEEILLHFDLFPPNDWLQCTKKYRKKKKLPRTVQGFVKSCRKTINEGKYFENILYLSQIHQAMAYKTETEHYRRWRSSVNQTSGEGLTMCALYWQLNDIWQAPTWSSIDFGMKWKMVHYYAKNFFAPLLVSPFIDGENLKISVISDLVEPLNNYSVIIDVYFWGNFDPVFSHVVRLKTIQPSSAAIVFASNLSNILAGLNPETVDLFFNTRLMTNDDKYVPPNNVVFPQSFKLVPKDKFGKVTVTNVQTTSAPNVYSITLTTTAPASFVWLNVKNIRGWFTDNGFMMMTRNMQIFFKAWNATTLNDVSMNLTVMSLGDLYRPQQS